MHVKQGLRRIELEFMKLSGGADGGRRSADDAVPSIGSRLVRSTSKSACRLFLESNQSQSRDRIWPRLILCMIVGSCRSVRDHLAPLIAFCRLQL